MQGVRLDALGSIESHDSALVAIMPTPRLKTRARALPRARMAIFTLSLTPIFGLKAMPLDGNNQSRRNLLPWIALDSIWIALDNIRE